MVSNFVSVFIQPVVRFQRVRLKVRSSLNVFANDRLKVTLSTRVKMSRACLSRLIIEKAKIQALFPIVRDP
jgi:hypothetical protein